MPNYLKIQKRQQVLALLELGWTYRHIEAETGVRRETVSRYDRLRRANAAKVFPGSDLPPRSSAAAYHDSIVEKLDLGLSLQRLWQDLVEEFGYASSYDSVKRYVRTLRRARRVVGVIHLPRSGSTPAASTTSRRPRPQPREGAHSSLRIIMKQLFGAGVRLRTGRFPEGPGATGPKVLPRRG